MLCLPGGPGRTMRLIFFPRPGPDFSERDRELLTLLRPHLREAYLDAERRRGQSAAALSLPRNASSSSQRQRPP
jgi:hypothetical protein